MTRPQDSVTVALTGLPVAILILAAVLALLISIALLKLYRRAVFRSMRARADRGRIELVTPEPRPSPNRSASAAPDLSVLGHATSDMTGSGAEALYSGLLRVPWRAAAVYATAGLCYALVMSPASLIALKVEPLPFRLLLSFWVYAWPIVLTVGLVAAATRRAKLASAACYFLVLATLDVIAVFRSSTFVFGSSLVLWANWNLPTMLLLWAFLNRRVRAVGPLVLAFTVVALTGSSVALVIAGSSKRLLQSLATIGVTFRLGPDAILTGLIVLGFVLFGLAGWLVLRWIGGRYEHKKISDQSVTLDSIWLLFGVMWSIPLVFGGAAWILLGFFAFIVYKLVTRVGFSLLRHDTAPENSPKLLLLRVFSLGKRSERLFDALAKHWRHVGSIRLIAGPDLATTTIEPHEFLEFLSGRLARRFIDGRKTLDLGTSEVDLQPDRDGRFRVNDFFCYADTWQMVLSRLEDDSDAVLMDLRGFSQENRGVIYEIGELINVVPLGRVVFVVDQTTDEEFLSQAVQECWNRMRSTSPNRASTPEQLNLLWFGASQSGALRPLLHALCVAARPTAPVDTNKPASV